MKQVLLQHTSQARSCWRNFIITCAYTYTGRLVIKNNAVISNSLSQTAAVWKFAAFKINAGNFEEAAERLDWACLKTRLVVKESHWRKASRKENPWKTKSNAAGRNDARSWIKDIGNNYEKLKETAEDVKAWRHWERTCHWAEHTMNEWMKTRKCETPMASTICGSPWIHRLGSWPWHLTFDF